MRVGRRGSATPEPRLASGVADASDRAEPQSGSVTDRPEGADRIDVESADAGRVADSYWASLTIRTCRDSHTVVVRRTQRGHGRQSESATSESGTSRAHTGSTRTMAASLS
jgi:hypothetical protein